MHADNEGTFISDYKAIGKELGVDEGLDDSDLLNAVRGVGLKHGRHGLSSSMVSMIYGCLEPG